MAQLATVQFIKDDGFATGLTPTVTITEARTGTVRGTFTMSEVSPGNYIYDYIDGADDMLFFFNYDAGTDDVINRYQGNNNRIEISRGGGGGITTVKNNVINREQMERIADIVLEKLPKIEIPQFDTKNIEERLGLIEMKIDESVVEFDYDIILSSVENNALKITKEIKSIKIPKQDNKPIIDAILRVESKVDKVGEEVKGDIQTVKERTSKIKTKHEKKIEELEEFLMEKGIEAELDDFMEGEFISSIKEDE